MGLSIPIPVLDEIKGRIGICPDEGKLNPDGPGKMLMPLDVWAGAWKRADGGHMTYCNIETEETTISSLVYEMSDLKNGLTVCCRNIGSGQMQTLLGRNFSSGFHLHSLSFRSRTEWTKELVTHVYHTICHSRKLFIEAPTGAG